MIDLRVVQSELVERHRPWWKPWAPRVSQVRRTTYQLSRGGVPGPTLTYYPDPGPSAVCAWVAIAYLEAAIFAAPAD